MDLVKKVLIEKINKSEWWHVFPRDHDAYTKRGKFFASTFQQAAFYGRPNDIPSRVLIKNPIYGFFEAEILKKLFPETYKDRILSENADSKNWYKKRIALDLAIFRKAKLLGYDAVILMSANGKKYLENNKKPPSIELNLLYPPARKMIVRNKQVKPFLKWVGGKTQLLNDLEARLPDNIKEDKVIDCYIEPFVGGGALFFYLKSKYKINKAYLIDNNKDLILTYKVIKKSPENIIKELQKIEAAYLKLDNKKRSDFYYEIRKKFNRQREVLNYKKYNNQWEKRASYLIFLNKTCFNGLFRQNSNGGFNVPHGRYKNPKICDADNLKKVSRALKGTRIICDDFSLCEKYAAPKTLIYFDPPYRPLNITSNFTAYTKNGFCDNEQVRLANLCKDLSRNNIYILLSNSDPTNENKKDKFFDEIYDDFNIQRVLANRMINCNGDKRGQVKELLIANY